MGPIFAPRPQMGYVVPMDSKLPSNYRYMSWPSWPIHISKLCSHKKQGFTSPLIKGIAQNSGQIDKVLEQLYTLILKILSKNIKKYKSLRLFGEVDSAIIANDNHFWPFLP